MEVGSWSEISGVHGDASMNARARALLCAFTWGKEHYSVFAYRRGISTDQAALVMMYIRQDARERNVLPTCKDAVRVAKGLIQLEFRILLGT